MNTSTFWTTHLDAWDAMERSIDGASERVWYEQFIFGNPQKNTSAQRFFQAFLRAAKRGVEVRLLLDTFGSKDFLHSLYRKQLEEAGVRIKGFSTPRRERFSHLMYPIMVGHRKILITDNTAQTGGVFVLDRVADWDDFWIEVEGEGAKLCVDGFEQGWKHVRKGMKMFPLRRNNVFSGGSYALTNRPGFFGREIYEMLALNLNHAEKSIKIVTPYFAPNLRLTNTLIRAARAGVRVEIIIPQKTDHPFVDSIARTYFSALLESGAHIYCRKRMIHAKIVLIDECWVTFGSCNFDYLSLFWNYEFNLAGTDKVLVDPCLSAFERYKGRSQELSTAEWSKRSLKNKIILQALKALRFTG